MKILQINKFLFPNGGSETYMFQLAKALQEKGNEVKFWGMKDSRNIVSDFPDFEVDNIDYSNQSALQKMTSAMRTIYSEKNKKKIAKVLDVFQPDIVHIHNYNFQITPSILPVIHKRGIKIVLTTHDSQIVCPYHRLFNFQQNTICTKCVKGSFVNCIKDKCFDGSLMKSTVGTIESMLYHGLNYYEKYLDAIISPSNFLAQLLSNRIKKEINIIPNFTEVTYLQKGADSTYKDYYLYYGRISEEKGVLELIDIFKETELNLIFVGTGPLEEEIKKSSHLHSNIDYLGPKYNEELIKLVQQAKYVIQPSKGLENCPMTIIESYALGIPVIGPNHSGFKDLIEHGKTGFLLDFSDKKNIIKEILKIDTLENNSLKENIKSFYKTSLAKEIHINKIEQVYHSLV